MFVNGAYVNQPTANVSQSTNYLPFMMGISALSGAFSSYQQGKTRKTIARANARTARMQAEDARKRGHEAEGISRQKTKKLVGTQRANMAAAGIKLTDGSAYDIQQETQDIGELDALTIRNNAARQAFGYQTEALNASMEGRFAYQEGINQGLNSLLTGGLQAYAYGKKYGF